MRMEVVFRFAEKSYDAAMDKINDDLTNIYGHIPGEYIIETLEIEPVYTMAGNILHLNVTAHVRIL